MRVSDFEQIESKEFENHCTDITRRSNLFEWSAKRRQKTNIDSNYIPVTSNPNIPKSNE